MVTGFSIESILSSKPKCTRSLESQGESPFISFDSRRPIYYSRHVWPQMSAEKILPHISSHPASDDEDDKVTRRPRTSITLCQRDFLEEEFQKERYPTLAYIDKLSRQIHLPQYVIKVWFQNRRAKYRKEGHRKKRARNHNNEDNTITSIQSSVSPWKSKPSKIVSVQTSYHSLITHGSKSGEHFKELSMKHQCACHKCRMGAQFVI